MELFSGRGDIARDVIPSVVTRDVDSIETRTTIVTTKTEKDLTTTAISTPKAGSTTSVAPTQDQTTALGQNAWPWNGDWTAGGNPWSGRWGGMPTTVITLASTVTYTDPQSTAKTSQSTPVVPMASETGIEGLDISGPVAAGIGVGASVGLLGLCLGAAYVCRKGLRRNRHQLSLVQTTKHIKTDDVIWPPYLYSASNESPIELSATRSPKELDTEVRPREQDLSKNLGIVELDGSGMVNPN
ncbi:hypothetical protein F5B22DRAFT_648258 [Xylaria bambusicola]|uniref:uncharacterized protein n=1 Tax=Xylaria bambusicola TaxID=326684 RepID=UPI0020083B80|nr:uncharacterized protein F5B22DRAFT_648258 [Xylaria bambusicola]KAI0512907.1 hypothetical protein F5B22DRAFT_648258 [Xylaria bambusicola]